MAIRTPPQCGGVFVCALYGCCTLRRVLHSALLLLCSIDTTNSHRKKRIYQTVQADTILLRYFYECSVNAPWYACRKLPTGCLVRIQFRRRYVAPLCLCRFNPRGNRIRNIPQRLRLRFAIRNTARKLKNLRQKPAAILFGQCGKCNLIGINICHDTHPLLLHNTFIQCQRSFYIDCLQWAMFSSGIYR